MTTEGYVAPERPLCTKSYQLAVDIVRLAQSLGHDKHEFVVSRQVLRSGTSIGANVEEAKKHMAPIRVASLP